MSKNMERPIVRHALVGVAIGFGLSASFYFFWGAFQTIGFFLWSIVGGGGGGVLGGYLTGRILGTERAAFGLFGAALGAFAVRVAIFVLFGSY